MIYNKFMFNFKKKQKPIIPYIEVHIVDHCNLKCNYCSHFCHLVNEEIFIDINEYKKDLEELSKKINIFQIRIMGGEPLLHPQLNEFIKEARFFFPNSRISIVSNGILLPTMNEEFWNTLKQYNTYIDLTKYPILGNKFSEILDLIDDHNMQPGHIKLAKKFYESLNINGDSDINKSHSVCGSKSSVNLWNHKLYPCQNCFRYYYNKKYNTNLELPPAVDFYKLSGEQIKRELIKYKKPFDACRFCLEAGITHQWSKYEGK